MLDEGRRLNDEWRDELQRRRSAFSLSSLVRREAKPKRIPANDFLLRLAPTLRKKAHNYKERGMDLGELDIIAFASLKREVLDLNSHFPPPLNTCVRAGGRCRWSVRRLPVFYLRIRTRRTSCAATWGAASCSMSGSACEPVRGHGETTARVLQSEILRLDDTVSVESSRQRLCSVQRSLNQPVASTHSATST